MIRFLPYYLLPLNVLFDVLLMLFDGGGLLPYLRAGLMLLLIFYFILKNEAFTNHYGWLIVFSIYCIINVGFSTDFLRSLNITLKVLIPMLSFIIGFTAMHTENQIKKLNVSIIAVYVILILNYITSQSLGIGKSVYTGGNDFLVGGMDDNWNVFTYSVLIAPLILYYYKHQFIKRWGTIALAAATSLMVVISLKRIAIIGLLSGHSIRFFFLPKVFNALRVITGLSAILFILLPYYEDLFRSRLAARSSRFEQGAIERESRFVETFYVWNEVFSFDDPAKSLFGLEGFNSVGNYASGRFGNRNLHMDYNLIVNTIGLVGLILYFLVFLHMFILFRMYQKRSTISKESIRELRATAYMLLITPFITSFAGQMYHISYRMIVFVYLGAIIGTFYFSANAHTHRLQR